MSEAEIELKPPSCLDSTYERRAIDQGMNSNPVFPENIAYLKLREYYTCILTSKTKNSKNN